jgi:hypothetical protein
MYHTPAYTNIYGKFKCEVIQCTEEKGNHKAAVIFEVDESNV